MAETSKKEIVGVCDCTTNGGMMLQRHMMHRMIFVLLVVMLAFWCGLKLGEIKGFIAASYTPMPARGGMMFYDMSDRAMMEKGIVPAPAEAPAPAPATPAESAQ